MSTTARVNVALTPATPDNLPAAHAHPYWCDPTRCSRMWADGDTTHQMRIGEVKGVEIFIERIDDWDEHNRPRTGQPRMQFVSNGDYSLNLEDSANLRDLHELADRVLAEVSR